MLNKMGDKELSLDLLDELKSNNNTIIESSDAIRNILKEEIKQPKEDIDDDKDMDKSFYTKSLNLTDDLEGLDDKKESKTNKVLLRIFLIVAIVAIVVVGAVLVYTFLKNKY